MTDEESKTPRYPEIATRIGRDEEGIERVFGLTEYDTVGARVQLSFERADFSDETIAREFTRAAVLKFIGTVLKPRR